MIDVQQSGYITFRPRARLLKLIGAELISDEVVALTELVKNAFDADASQVTIEFIGATAEDGEIVVRDDGHGMSLDTLLRHWMEPAGTSKSGADRKRSRQGRRVLGEKGVGRFAVDKLARQLELVSRCPDTNTEVHAWFDWDAFESETEMLSDIQTRYEVRPAALIERQGTVLRMRGLRSCWTERMFKRLSNRLGRLRSPFGERDRFAIVIESDEFPEYSGELRSTFLERAPYSIHAVFDGLETIELSLNGSEYKTFYYRHGDLSCGPVGVRLHGYDLETEALSKIGPQTDVRAWLKEWSGISIYRDGFRLWPYGEPHDDWLRLDQRRVNNPVVRLSNNQIVGFVEIAGDSNPELRDQTNREGLINNQAFNDLRMLMYYVLQILEAERQQRRHPQVHEQVEARVPVERAAVTADIERLASKADEKMAGELRRIGEKMRDMQAREENTQRRQIEVLTEMAALGQAVTGFAASTRPLLERMGRECFDLRRQSAQLEPTYLAKRLGFLEEAVRDLTAQLAMLEPVEQGGGKRRAIDLIKELEVSHRMLLNTLEYRGVKRFELGAAERGIYRTEMRPENFHRLIHILTMNSLDWIGKSSDARISVTLGGDDHSCEVMFADNGTGIPLRYATEVFEPFFTMKEGGRGLGLTLAKGIVTQHGGSIEVATPQNHQGTVIRIRLPRKRARTTMY